MMGWTLLLIVTCLLGYQTTKLNELKERMRSLEQDLRFSGMQTLYKLMQEEDDVGDIMKCVEELSHAERKAVCIFFKYDSAGIVKSLPEYISWKRNQVKERKQAEMNELVGK